MPGFCDELLRKWVKPSGVRGQGASSGIAEWAVFGAMTGDAFLLRQAVRARVYSPRASARALRVQAESR